MKRLWMCAFVLGLAGATVLQADKGGRGNGRWGRNDGFFLGGRTDGLPPGLAKRGGNLPPGLQRHIDRTGQLPPGLEKRRGNSIFLGDRGFRDSRRLRDGAGHRLLHNRSRDEHRVFHDRFGDRLTREQHREYHRSLRQQHRTYHRHRGR
ncbi:MAG: hypothetical protein ACREUU_06730 [Gammaproteobacteria bacterium]